MDLQELSKEIKDLVISAYLFGFEEKDGGLAPFNGEKEELDRLQWLQDCLVSPKITENA